MPEDPTPLAPSRPRTPQRKLTPSPKPSSPPESVRPEEEIGSARKLHPPKAKLKSRTARQIRAAQAPRDPGGEVERASGRDVDATPEERLFDELVDYGNVARDLDRMASRNPRTAVLGGLAIGFLIGFGAGLLAARD